MSPQFVAVSGPLSGRAFPLGAAPLSFGRTPDNAIVLVSPLASRRHAEVRIEAGGYVLYDLGSSNGTLVNGQRVSTHRLRAGDVVTIGDESFRFEEPVAAQVAPTAGAPPPPAAAPQPLPPLTPPPPPSSFPSPQPGTSQPSWRGGQVRIILALVALLGFALMAGLAGGIFLLTRGGLAGGGGQGAFGDPTPAGPAPTRGPVAEGAARWTVLVYLDGDNNLEADALDDFREMATVGSSDELKIVVQLDRISSRESWDDTSAGDWDGTMRFLVERGMEPEAEAAIEDLGELNMGDGTTLADFIEWGVTNYPAERYALIIWDHGASWLGIASDDTDGGDVLSLPELSAALETARDRSGYGTFDLIGFDACLMAQLDVFQAIEPYGQVAVASAELEPNQGWAWDVWLAALAADPAQDAATIAPVIVESYIDSFEGSGVDDVTLSAFDLAQLREVSDRLAGLSRAMIDGIAEGYTAIAEARSYVAVYAPSYPEEFNAVDLGHFAQLLPERGAGPEVVAAAEALESAIDQARLANGAGSYHRNTSGLSIYFPQIPELYVDAYERGSPLPRLTGWHDFLQAFHSAGTTAVTRPTVGGLELSDSTVSVNSPVSLTGSVTGEGIAYVFSFIGIPNASRDTVDLIAVDFIYPPGAAPSGDAPRWESGSFDLRLEWDATNWFLSNGSEEIEVLLGPVRYGTNLYGVEGVYTSQATGEQIDAGLIFNVSQGQGTLARIWGFPRGTSGQEPQPYELIPAPGDRFTAFTRSYTDTGAELEPGRVEGQTITFGDGPLTARLGGTSSGDYVMGFLVRDIAGSFSYDYVDVTVDNSGANNQPAPAGGISGPGAQAGFLAYSNPSLGFRIEYPELWEPFDTGRDKIVFYNPAVADDVYVSVDVYSLGLSEAEANAEIMRQLLDLARETAQGELRVPEEAFTAAGRDGLKAEYVYRNSAGAPIYVVAIAVTSPASGRTYLLTIEAPEERFDGQLATFNTMLETFEID
ncbi:MAG: clostripain-related cysteine peptidase [Chloroflexi bacterium OHK40]